MLHVKRLIHSHPLGRLDAIITRSISLEDILERARRCQTPLAKKRIISSLLETETSETSSVLQNRSSGLCV